QGASISGVHQDNDTNNGVSAGDINGDGIDDLIMGASKANDNAGEVWVIYGGQDLANKDLTNLQPSQGIKITSAKKNDTLGSAVGTGDINGDGIKDLIIGAPS